MENIHQSFALKKFSVEYFPEIVLKRSAGASLVAQWLRICLPMQGT